MYEGEVTELSPVETENPMAGYSKKVSQVVIGHGLQTANGNKQLKLDPSIYESLKKERVEVGNVIYIEANSGAVKRLGRSDTFTTEFDIEAEEYVPPPLNSIDLIIFTCYMLTKNPFPGRCSHKKRGHPRCHSP